MNLIRLLNKNQYINYLPEDKATRNLIKKYLIDETYSHINLESVVDTQQIYVPIHFSIGVTKLNDKLSKLFNLKIVSKPVHKYPKAVDDLKLLINSKNISSLDDLRNNVIKYNNEIKPYSKE
jgi:hypothetical protein